MIVQFVARCGVVRAAIIHCPRQTEVLSLLAPVSLPTVEEAVDHCPRLIMMIRFAPLRICTTGIGEPRRTCVREIDNIRGERGRGLGFGALPPHAAVGPTLGKDAYEANNGLLPRASSRR